MNDALDRHTHEPKDPVGDRFPDFHHGHAQAAFNEEVVKRLAALEKDILRLEKRATAHALDNNSALGAIAVLRERLAALEAQLAKQRAVNKELLEWVDVFPKSDVGFARLAGVLRGALK